MRLSVILSTYNSPDWLEKAIWGYQAQSYRDFEIVVADDGSTDATRERLDRLRAETGLAIRQVWHADRGFRKCTILNRAIETAASDYLVFSDGDCIPRWDFLDVHARFAKPGRFLSGGLFRLPLDLSQRIARDDILQRRATDPSWLVENGVRRRLKLIKLAAGRSAPLLDRLTPTKPTWNGHNSSGWKRDLLAVNGFDERMEYGAEDRELGDRLMHAGIRPFQIRHRAVCVHLDHARGYIRAEALARNMQIWKATRRSKTCWTDFGIQQSPLPQIAAAIDARRVA